MDTDVALQKYIATILSDGNLRLRAESQNASFGLALSDNKNRLHREQIPVEDLLAFLQGFVVSVLNPLGITPMEGYPRVESNIGKSTTGRELPGVSLYTLVSTLNTELYHKIYPGNIKTVPEDFAFSDISLSWFFMFDGSSWWSRNGSPLVNVSLCTLGFDYHSVELLEKQLHTMGINTGRVLYKGVNNGAGIAISIPADSTDHFMRIVEPHVLHPYRYKIKYRGSCPPVLAQKNREQFNKNRKSWRDRRKDLMLV